MIATAELINNLNTKLNLNPLGLNFKVRLDTGEIKKPKRIDRTNEWETPVNGLMKITATNVSNLVDGSVFATVSARVQFTIPVWGEEEDKIFTETTYDASGNPTTTTKTVLGYGNKLQAIRTFLTNAFAENEQAPMTDADGKTYSVITIYSFPNSGERNIVQNIGDSFIFTMIITYLFVENGINTYDIKYYLDGEKIPYQACTVYRTPTMEGNVYGDTTNGATRNIATQSVFSVAIELPAIKSVTTAKLFDWLFKGKMNVAHILIIEYPNPEGTGTKQEGYLVTLGEVKAIGNTIQNIGQTATLVETDDDYELISFPETYYIYRCTTATNAEAFTKDACFCNFTNKTYGKGATATVSFAVGDMLISTAPLTTASAVNFTLV